MNKRNYVEPRTEALYLSLETLVCLSGDKEDLTKDPIVNPWSVMSESADLF